MAEVTLNKNMIEGQIKPINGMSEELLSVFYSLDRNDFMPEDQKEMSYVEKNIILQDQRTILKPSLIAQIALSINLQFNENVMILGATNGYLSAILSYLAETVIVVEEDEQLLNSAAASIKKK